VSLKAGGLEVDAMIAFGANGAIDQVEIGHLKRGGTDVNVAVQRQAEREFAIRIEGPSVDLEPVLDSKSEAKTDTAGPRLQIQLKTDHLAVTPTLSLASVSANLTNDGKLWRSITVDAMTGPGALKLALSAAERGQSFQLTSPDAGAALNGLGVLDNLSGGTLTAEGTVDIDAPGLPVDGRFDIRDATLVHAPVLARVASLASLTGIDEALTGRGVGFSRIGGKVSHAAGTLAISDFGAYGPPMALTGKGSVDIASDTVHFECTLVPANGLSQMIGAIPVIGHIITGFKTEGVLAVDFMIDGTLDKPQVKVNPLTVIAPGFLRDLVRLFGPAEGMAEDIERTARRDGAN
jgi:hypothetical protein